MFDGYLVGVVAATLIVAFLSVLMKDGKTKPAVKWALALSLTLVYMAPLLRFFGNSSIKKESGVFEFELQTDFLSLIYDKKKENDLKRFDKKMEELKVSEYETYVEYSTENGNIVYKIFRMHVKSDVIFTDKSHIDILQEINAAAEDIFGVPAEIVFYEENPAG